MVYTNMQYTEQGNHGIFEASRLKSNITGHIYDVLVRDNSNKEIDVDNGVCVVVGDYTGNGLQERYGKVAGVKDQVAITGAPALIKDSFTKTQASPYNFYNKAGIPVKTWELVKEDIFGISLGQFTKESAAQVKVGAYVVLDGKGMYVAQADAPTATDHGFIGKVHSIAAGTYYTTVRIEVIQNAAQV